MFEVPRGELHGGIGRDQSWDMLGLKIICDIGVRGSACVSYERRERSIGSIGRKNTLNRCELAIKASSYYH